MPAGIKSAGNLFLKALKMALSLVGYHGYNCKAMIFNTQL